MRRRDFWTIIVVISVVVVIAGVAGGVGGFLAGRPKNPRYGIQDLMAMWGD